MQFNFQLYYKSGKTVQAEDSLFKRSDYENRVEHNNAELVLLKSEFFAISAINTSYKSVFDNEKILKEVKIALLSDKVIKNYKSLLKSESREFGKFLQDWNFKNSLLLYREKIYILKDNELRKEVI